MTFPPLLDDQQTQIWQDERQQIQYLIKLLEGWDVETIDLERLRQAQNQLSELFLLVVVGEFNSGKSALINALLGHPYLKEGVTPTTDRIHILQYGESGPPEFAGDDARVFRFPVDFLREIHVVDTPGTNAVLRHHEAIARDFVPRSDMVIFVTSADRSFTESERSFLEHIRQWGKKIIFVINKADILASTEDADEILSFVKDQAHRLLDFDPTVFMLSARQALRQVMENDSEPSDGQADGFHAFRGYLMDNLGQENRVRLKLLNPLGVALKISRQYQALAEQRLHVLTEDTQALRKVDRQIELYEEDTQSEFERHLARVETELLEMRLRGEEFLDDRMRLLKIRAMLQGDRMRQSFEREVVADTPERIESHIQEIIDWLVERDLRQWRLTANELNRRRETEMLQDAAREASDGFVYNRRQLLDNLGVRAEQVIGGYDRKGEAARLTMTIQESVAMVGLVEVSAIGLGLLLKALLVGATADATGLLAAGVLGILGLAILPYRRGVAKRELRKKMEDLRGRLNHVLRESFKRELEQSASRLREAIAPYRRFVLSEEKSLKHIAQELDAVEGRLLDLESTLKAGEEVQAVEP
jgi:small GTP-binding protein